MASVGWGISARRWRVDMRYAIERRPELPAAALVGAAWVLMNVVMHGPFGSTSSPHSMHDMGMPGMAMGRDAGAPGASASWYAGVPSWMLMVVAMMGPPALAGVRHTARNSLRWRRNRAIAEFAAGYLFVWTGYGAIALLVARNVPASTGWTALAIVLAASAAWQLGPYKKRALRNCHRSVPLPPTGWRAEAGAFRFGLRNGSACVGSCWCLMLVMVVAPVGMLLLSAVLTIVLTAERLVPRPRSWTRAIAAGSIAGSAVSFAVAFA